MEVFWAIFNWPGHGSWAVKAHENIDLAGNSRNRWDVIKEIRPVALHGGIWHRMARRRRQPVRQF